MKKTVISHLEELRKRIITAAISVAFFAAAGMLFSGWFIKVLTDNLTTNITVKFIALTPFEFIAAQIKLGIFIGIILSVPIIAYELARFVRPALKRKERKSLYASVLAGILLFALGFAFAYFIFLKYALVFLGGLAVSHGVENYWSIGQFVTMVFMSCTMMGAVFDMPVLAFLLSRIGIINKALLKGKRRYIYVLLFILAALITPTPDVVNMLLVALPMIALYEISALLVTS
jgi:sec-independent protein translocase protein TatC